MGEELPYKLGLSNSEDRHVERGVVIIGHMPKRVSLICSSLVR